VIVFLWGGGEGQRPLVPLLLLGPPFSPIIIFLVNRDDRHLLAHAMASDFTVAWHPTGLELVNELKQI
jgi:hypothetical protein